MSMTNNLWILGPETVIAPLLMLAAISILEPRETPGSTHIDRNLRVSHVDDPTQP